MKKIIILILSISFLFSGCNFPFDKSTPAPKTNVLATAVSQTLTAKPVLPSEVSGAGKQNDTPTPTLQNTATIPPTSTQTVTTTPDSLKKTLGTPVWQTGLDTGKSFGLAAGGYQDENTRITIENGAMILNSTSTVGFRTWRLSSPTPENFYLEATFKPLSCGNADSYGLVFRAPDYSSGLGYYFGITCNGNYSLYKWSSSTANVILSGSSPLIPTSAGQTIRMSVMAKGSNFTFYINDKILQTFSDSELANGGHTSTFIGGYSGNFTVQMDEIAYWDVH